MNCKPRDLARVIDKPETRRVGIVDRFVTCVEMVNRAGDSAWMIEPRLRCSCGCGGFIAGIEDDLLRPIRPAGDDERTQETRKLPIDAGIVQLRETVRAFQAMRDAGVCP